MQHAWDLFSDMPRAALHGHVAECSQNSIGVVGERTAVSFLYRKKKREIKEIIYPNNSRDVYLYIYSVSAYMG